ncbi:STAS domain-containing protein [Cereibacter azotoformans]|uniref:Chemotaxis protein CheX n=2 Tax=Cereibacter TaxID=1653176 RepID=A0A2T5KDQ4_9RHOB|nr:STAS domain-containing protein [Cereibacter azotoformans]AXQ93743.1 STAS domain-containing protein [Cereibacter sphaeroides]MBO4168460.1 STAS domain-containing protein [Cereibacter azotoformans]PTR20551.1 chemotaxis protein CheX [Cereibacter azotoformans]UIJ29253.1 STAS domain-containing protein [Cereibacter azotoformans]ULB09940.1 STAS domain-containing protein [Cereibacter azotoformans]
MNNHFDLPERLNHQGARHLYAALLGMPPGDTTLNAGGVTFVGGLALQVLLSAAAQWRSRGFRFDCLTMSPAFTDDIARMGVDPKELREIGSHAADYSCH